MRQKERHILSFIKKNIIQRLRKTAGVVSSLTAIISISARRHQYWDKKKVKLSL
jgi:hypothetical protein